MSACLNVESPVEMYVQYLFRVGSFAMKGATAK